MSPNELRALVNLLDDPDEEIYSHVKTKLLSMGRPIIPFLENVWEMGDPFNQTVQHRIENIIHQIQFEIIESDLSNWAKNNQTDLLEGAIIVARYQYPDLNEEKIKNKIHQIIQDVWIELNNNLTAFEKVKVINHIIYDVHGFSGNTTNYHAPQNSYINNVIETKKGNPLSLSILYSIVAQKLNIPIYGINLPEHFILGYKIDPEMKLILENAVNESDIFFYINPFSRGAIFYKKEIDAFIKQLQLEPERKYYEPCSNLDIIARMLRNLIFSYEKSGYLNKMRELEKLHTAVLHK
jgi:regulator of sirC expression with transglutaminase-like and TPR domain